MKLTVINGNRQVLEDRLIEKLHNGRDYQEELERMRPKGDLYLVGSPRTSSNDNDYDWLVFDEISP